MMNETSDTMKTMSGSTAGMGTSGAAGSTAMETAAAGNVQRVAQKAHEAVDRLEHSLSSGTERMMGWQEEYGEMAREQIRANPLAVVFGAFAVGYLFAKLTR